MKTIVIFVAILFIGLGDSRRHVEQQSDNIMDTIPEEGKIMISELGFKIWFWIFFNLTTKIYVSKIINLI